MMPTNPRNSPVGRTGLLVNLMQDGKISTPSHYILRKQCISQNSWKLACSLGNQGTFEHSCTCSFSLFSCWVIYVGSFGWKIKDQEILSKRKNFKSILQILSTYYKVSTELKSKFNIILSRFQYTN